MTADPWTPAVASPHDASDADLAARAARGDHVALDALWTRHGDAVHDHVARVTGDAAVAEAATATAFTELLEDLAAGTVPTAVRPSLLGAARSHAERLRGPGAAAAVPISPALLAASGTTRMSPEEGAAAWARSSALDPAVASALDLTQRQGLAEHDLGAVLGLPSDDVQDLLDEVREQTDADTRAAYAALAVVPAPVAARSAVTARASELIGRPHALARIVRLRAVTALGVVALVVLGLGLASVLDQEETEPTAGPVTVVAVPVVAEPEPSPTPSPTPTPTPTLDTLGQSAATPTPEPTDAPDPTPEPASSPSPTQTLAVAIDRPVPGATHDATQGTSADTQAALVPVAAAVSGLGSNGTVVWTSSLDPGRPLLDRASGEVLLRLAQPCTELTHSLTVTVTDAQAASATASVDVLVRDTCEELPTVRIDLPQDGRVLAATADDGGGQQVAFDVGAVTAARGELGWRWSASTATSGVTTTLAGPTGPSGTAVLTVDGCPTGQRVPVALRVDLTRLADEATATGSITLQVDCAAT